MTQVIRSLKGQRGMTLVEILVVLAVVGVLFAIAAPSISNQVALQEMRNATAEIVDVLRDARSSAVDEGVPRYVLFDSPRSYQPWRYDGTAWVAETAEQDLSATVEFDPVNFKSYNDEPETGATVPSNAVYFDTRGGYPNTPGLAGSYSITLRGGVGRVETITVHTSTGQVTT
jgi:type II secretion system protein H